MSFAKRLVAPTVVNHVLRDTSSPPHDKTLIIATGNKKKIAEFQRILKDFEVIGKKLAIEEIQSEDHQVVVEQKARDAWKLNDGRPILVEDSGLFIAALDGLPGPFADQFTNTRGKREQLCKMLPNVDRNAHFQVGVAMYDGLEVHSWIGKVTGVIADSPQGADSFGFDDIFIPDGQKGQEKKTYSQMTEVEKDALSPRRVALEAFMNTPPDVGIPVFSLPNPMRMQTENVLRDTLTSSESLAYAYALEPLEGNAPDPKLTVTNRKPYKEYSLGNGEIKRIAIEGSTSIGLVYTPMDIWVGVEGKSRRLLADEFGNLRYWQMSDAEVGMALAGRAYEFTLHHNDAMYDMLRDMMKGKIQTAPRPNKPSPAIEKLLDSIRSGTSASNEEFMMLSTAATREIGYSRISSERKMSRSASADTGLILTTAGFPSSLFALGGMPPVTGWRDVLVSAAMSYMRCYIPRNSIFAGSMDRQLALFQDAVRVIHSFHLPRDIEEVVIRQIGVSVGCEDPEGIVRALKRLQEAGCSSARIYTTNPDYRTVATAKAIRQAFGEAFTICVGPIVDKKQADILIGPDIRTNVLLAGHGGGENCTSLEGGGTANALEILYLMYLDPVFNGTAIGLEGGTGNSFGSLLGMLDVISLNRRGVKGGIETGGLYFEHSDGSIVQPYSGSASAITQWIEAEMDPSIARRRLNPAGSLRNVEGKPNYMRKGRAIHSITDNFREQRMLAGRALADQEATSISELRENITRAGSITNHRYVSSTAAEIASAHRTQV